MPSRGRLSISMTAGAVASLISDDLDVIERAAVLGAQSILGQICDPIEGAGKFPASSATLRPFRLPLPAPMLRSADAKH